MTTGGDTSCSTTAGVQTTGGILSCVSFIAIVFSTAHTLRRNEARRRYPGRLVTCLGASIGLLTLSNAIGFIEGYRQLSYGDDDAGENDSATFWKEACQIQGAIGTFAYVCISTYSLWLCVALYSAVSRRHNAHIVIHTSHHLICEVLAHTLLVATAVFFAFELQHWVGIGPKSGLTSCWIEDVAGNNGAKEYVVLAMAGPYAIGFILLNKSTRDLWQVLKSSPDAYSASYRPLRRILYGNATWAFLMLIIVVFVVLFDTLTDHDSELCWLANIAHWALGCLFVLNFNVLPAWFERCTEKRDLGSYQPSNAASAGDDGLYDIANDTASRTSYFTRVSTLTSSHRSGGSTLTSSHRSGGSTLTSSSHKSGVNSLFSQRSFRNSIFSDEKEVSGGLGENAGNQAQRVAGLNAPLLGDQ